MLRNGHSNYLIGVTTHYCNTVLWDLIIMPVPQMSGSLIFQQKPVAPSSDTADGWSAFRWTYICALGSPLSSLRQYAAFTARSIQNRMAYGYRNVCLVISKKRHKIKYVVPKMCITRYRLKYTIPVTWNDHHGVPNYRPIECIQPFIHTNSKW